MTKHNDKLIVALDVPTFEEARTLIEQLSAIISTFKVGSQLFTACGPVVIRYLQALGKKAFLDLKFHDIPNTVANAVEAAVGIHLGVHGAQVNEGGCLMYTMHITGGKAMMEAAVEAGTRKAKELKLKKPVALGITVLTSDEKKDNLADVVLERAWLAQKCGLDGVVASSQEAQLIRKELGSGFIIVTPGIRPKDEAVGDQQRVTTPLEAVRNGSNFLVVGRPIVKAANPKDAAQRILDEINSA